MRHIITVTPRIAEALAFTLHQHFTATVIQRTEYRRTIDATPSGISQSTRLHAFGFDHRNRGWSGQISQQRLGPRLFFGVASNAARQNDVAL